MSGAPAGSSEIKRANALKATESRAEQKGEPSLLCHPTLPSLLSPGDAPIYLNQENRKLLMMTRTAARHEHHCQGQHPEMCCDSLETGGYIGR